MGKSTSRNSPAIPPCRRCPHESRSPQTNPRSNHWAPATTPAAPPTTNTTTGPLFLPPHLARPKTHFTWIHSLQTPAMGNLCRKLQVPPQNIQTKARLKPSRIWNRNMFQVQAGSLCSIFKFLLVRRTFFCTSTIHSLIPIHELVNTSNNSV